MRPNDSVRDRVITLLLGMILLVSLVAGAGAVGVTSLTEDVDVLVDDLRPAAYSNIALRNDMSRAQAGARGWALTGDREFLRRYHAAASDARAELAHLAMLLRPDDALTESADSQKVAAEEWFSFAEGMLRRGPGPVPAPYLLDGQISFDRFTQGNDELSAAVNAAIEARGEAARHRARNVLVFVALVSLLGLLVTALIGRAIVRRVSGPLRKMEVAVERLACGDLGARVSTDGPREISGVAIALNTLAEENQRAREMEEQVVDQLRQLDRAKDEFVSTVSHELRTPLTSISGYIELLEDDFVDGLSPQQKGMLAILKRNVGRLRNLIEDLLTLSQVESDAFRTSFDLVDLHAVTEEVVREAVELAAQADVRVVDSAPDHEVLVHGDAVQLERAVLNLATNAVKFSAPGSEVQIRLEEIDGEAVVSVADHGIGIPADELATLGTRFFRASNAVELEIKGTGLGLRIVHTIADNHGGRLCMESVEGEGTTARIVVPLASDARNGNIPGLQEIVEG